MRKIHMLWTGVMAAALFATSAHAENLPSQVKEDFYRPVAAKKTSVLTSVANGTKKLVNSTVRGTKKVLSYPVNLVSSAVKKIKS